MWPKVYFTNYYYPGQYFEPIDSGITPPETGDAWNYRIFMRVRRR